MYPRNAASPERLAIGQVILIADGTVQTSGVSITVRPQAGAEAAGGGTTAYGADGTIYYTPTQAETNYTSFVVIAYKSSCLSASLTVITTASATSGKVVLSGETHTSAVIPLVSDITTKTGFSLTAGERTAIIDEFETQSQADPTGFHVNLMEVDGNANIMRKLKEYADANILFSDTAQAGGASSITLAAGTSVSDNDLKDFGIYINGGTGAGQFARIESVVAATQVATIKTPINGWATVPDVTSTYAILSAGSILHISSMHAAALTEITNELDTNSTLADWVNGGRLDLVLDELTTQGDTNETKLDTIQTRLPAALVGGLMSCDVTAISTSTDAADKLEASAETMLIGSATPTTLSTTQMSADGFTEATNDHFNGRIIIWTSGALLRQATDITDYDGATQTFTFTAVTEAPSDNDTFIIV